MLEFAGNAGQNWCAYRLMPVLDATFNFPKLLAKKYFVVNAIYQNITWTQLELHLSITAQSKK